MREWVNVNAEQYPGLRGAHLAGGITTCMSSDFMGQKQSRNKRDSLKVKKPERRSADGHFASAGAFVV
jgi:hypothetical protein